MSNILELSEIFEFIRELPTSRTYRNATEALTAIRVITSQTYTDKDRVYTALSLIDQLARKGLT